jgi:hypothetical protein
MRCLYCGKELALLKRLTGGGEFCSDAHKSSYQEEYNRLALSRLQQANKRGSAKAASEQRVDAGNPATPAAVAVADVVIPEPVIHQALIPEARIPEARIPEARIPEARIPEARIPEARIEDEPPPPEPELIPDGADFTLSFPAITVLEDNPPLYVEPWLSSPAPPTMPKWDYRHPSALTVPTGELVAVPVPTVLRDRTPSAIAKINPNPEEFANAKVDVSVQLAVKLDHALPSAGTIKLGFSSSRSSDHSPKNLYAALAFPDREVATDTKLFEPPMTGWDFPDEDAPVQIPDSWLEGTEVDAEAAPSPPPEAVLESPASPKAALQALSRLHQDLLQEEVEEEPAPVNTSPVRVSVVRSLPIDDALDVSPPTEPISSAVAVAEPEPPMIATSIIEAAPAPVDDPPAPREAKKIIEIPLKDFPPAKASLVFEANALFGPSQPVLPRLKALPLRPKVALAPPGFKSQPADAEPRNPTPAKVRINPNLSPTEPVERSAPVQAAPAAVAPAPEKKVEESVNRSKTQPAPQPKPAEEAPQPRTVKVPNRNTARSSEFPSKQNKPEEQGSLTFEALELQLMTEKSGTFWGSLKAKLAIAIVLVVLAVLAYTYLGGKPAPTAQMTADGAGPSIMVGEGGWVQNWSGDPTGVHAGREITIYRPSLTLTDYRIEFQGQIENKSIGWVFRAADPNNYYAMKLALLSTATPLKAALFKYMVRNGRETEVGRVGLDTTVTSDTLFKVRVDVRGTKFNTSIQGQSVDSWTDDQLKQGGVGFLNERGERGRIKSVSISYLTGGTK